MKNDRNKNNFILFIFLTIFIIFINVAVLFDLYDLTGSYQTTDERQTILILFNHFIGLFAVGLMIRRFLAQHILGFQLLLISLLVILFYDSFQHFASIYLLNDIVNLKIGSLKTIDDFGRLHSSIFILAAAFLMDRIIPRNSLKKQSGVNILITIVGIAVFFLMTIFLLPLLPASEFTRYLTEKGIYHLSCLLLLIATVQFFILFFKTNHQVYFWFSFASLLFIFGALYGSIDSITLFSDLYFVLPLFGFAAFIIGIHEDNTRFLSSEKRLRNELEQSLFETEMSNQNLRSLFERTETGIAYLDKNNRITSADKSFATILGYNWQELKGKMFSNIVDSNDRKAFNNEKSKWLQGKETKFEITITRKSGQKIYTQVIVFPTLNRQNNFTDAKVVLRDINLWKRAEKNHKEMSVQLRKQLDEKSKEFEKTSEQYQTDMSFFNSLLSGVPEIIIVINNEGDCTFINQYARKITGFNVQEINKNRIPKFLLDLNRVKSAYGKSVNLNLQEYEADLRKKDGGVIKCLWTAQFLFDHNGKRIGTAGIGKNISSLIKEQQDQQKKYQEITRKLERKTGELDKTLHQFSDVIEASKKYASNGNLNAFLKEICKFVRLFGWKNVAIVTKNDQTNQYRLPASEGASLRRRGKKSFLDVLLNGKVERYLKAEHQIHNSYRFDLLEDASDKKKKRILLVPIQSENNTIGWLFASMLTTAGKESNHISLFETLASYIGFLIRDYQNNKNTDRILSDLKKENQLKTEFMNKTSHEIRTPLNSIQTITELLQNELAGRLNHEQKTQVDLIKKNADNLLNLINNFLDIAKIESGYEELSFSLFSVDHLLNSIQSMFEPLSKSKGINLLTQKNKHVPEYIFSDEGKISQTLSNLVSNAVKFTNKGNVQLKIKTDRRVPSFNISISDTGIGIPRKDLNNIFLEFKQIKSQDFSKKKGTGLGLTIAKRNVELLGGDIQVKSEPNKGTQFDIVLPMKRVGDINIVGNRVTRDFSIKKRRTSTQKKKNARSRVQHTQTRHSNSAISKRNGRSILIIDDEEGSQYATKFYFEEKKFRVFTSKNGEEGIRLVKRMKPDLIVLDMVLPGLNGIEVTKKIRTVKGTETIPIIATTGKAGKVDRKKALDAGCNDYLIKPFSLDDLAKKVDFLLKQNKK